MANTEQKLSSPHFWLICGIINHSIASLVVIFGCVYSGFSCTGKTMSSVISSYTFTLFTPQVAFEVIILLALFLLNGSLKSLIKHSSLTLAFIASFILPLVLIL